MATNNTSVVDFLKSRGINPTQGERFPLFETRKKLFGDLGLETSLGTFQGTAEQNTSLLNKLIQSERDLGVSLSATNLMDFVKTSAPVPSAEAGASDVINTAGEQPDQTTASDLVPTEGASAADFLPEDPDPTEQAKQAEEDFLGSTGFAFAQEEAAASKEALRIKGQKDTENLIQDLASKGLAFSGIRDKEVTAQEELNLSAQLGVDRRFARMIAIGIQKTASDLAKDASKGKQEALDALKDLGYTVVNGQLVLTASEQRAQQRDILAESREERAMRAEERAEKRMDMALRAAERAEISLQSLLAERNNENGIEFSDIQITSGANVADIPVEDFQKLDFNTKSYFINNKVEIDKYKENINFVLGEEINPSDVEGFVGALDVPAEVKNTLVKGIKKRTGVLQKINPKFEFNKPKGAQTVTKELSKISQ